MHLPPTGLPPRVLHITQPVDGGVARVVTDVTRAQLAAGLRVAVACPDGPLADRLRSLGADVRHWPATRSPGPSLLSEVRRLARVLADVRPDVVHAHSAKAGLAGRLAVRGRIPTVFQPHAWSFEAVGGVAAVLALGWERWAARWTARTVCVSEAERLRGVRAGVRGPWTVIPNGIDPDRFRADAGSDTVRGVRLRHGVGPHAPLVVCVGRLCRQKGQDVLLSAWNAVLARMPDARLVLVGDGPDRTRLTERASAYGLLGGAAAPHRAGDPGPASGPSGPPGPPGPPGDGPDPGEDAPASVLFVGAVADAAVWYRAADLVVLPSRWEGMALAPLEAMASGRPVVVTDVDGAREGLPPALLPHCLVPPEDPSALAAAVTALLRDAPLCTSLGRRGRAHIRSAHDVRHTAAAVTAVYGDLLGTAPTTGTYALHDDDPLGADPATPHRPSAAPHDVQHTATVCTDPLRADPATPHRPSAAARLLPGDRPAAVDRSAVVPLEYRESTHP
ncbi:glycosyltransferase [Streptomyces sp. AC512_CC834]|uniref:glycosyltransferase n=1 Tax=Streptomyces sp. AC512_CC834 TaxID=2823691 RepID=UPI001C25E943|nr:glycosyltransferase [Streptomyces sp. AC512_CC834]